MLRCCSILAFTGCPYSLNVNGGSFLACVLFIMLPVGELFGNPFRYRMKGLVNFQPIVIFWFFDSQLIDLNQFRLLTITKMTWDHRNHSVACWCMLSATLLVLFLFFATTANIFRSSYSLCISSLFIFCQCTFTAKYPDCLQVTKIYNFIFLSFSPFRVQKLSRLILH